MPASPTGWMPSSAIATPVGEEEAAAVHRAYRRCPEETGANVRKPGMVAYLTKPVDMEQLLDLIDLPWTPIQR